MLEVFGDGLLDTTCGGSGKFACTFGGCVC
jgi:hypothetical protein